MSHGGFGPGLLMARVSSSSYPKPVSPSPGAQQLYKRPLWIGCRDEYPGPEIIYLFYRPRIFKGFFFSLILDGVKRKETKGNHVKILIHTKKDAFNFQIACYFSSLLRSLALL